MHLICSLLLMMLSLLTTVAFALTPADGWKDSYSHDGQCYCYSSFDHNVGGLEVMTSQGPKTVLEVCQAIGPGPGPQGNPVYNDIQCGNGPANDAGDETACPGRVDMGPDGCSIIGPVWNLQAAFPPAAEPPTPLPVASPEPEPVPVPEPEPIPVPPAAETPPPAPPAGISIEAENRDAADPHWVTISEFGASSIWSDSDGPHLNFASGDAYLELLPDTKQQAGDADLDGLWPVPGEGPQIHYGVEFAQPGVYQVRTLSFASGSFDRRIHVGINGYWPDSGAGIQLCSEAGRWNWTGCEPGGPATIEVPSAGYHVVQFSGFDDGFEMDRFVLTLTEQALSAAPVDSQPAVEQGVEAESTATATVEADANTPATNQPQLGQAIEVGGPLGYGAGSVRYVLLLLLCAALMLRMQPPRRSQA